MLTKDDLEQIGKLLEAERGHTKKLIEASESRVKSELRQEVKASEKRQGRKIHKVQNSLIQYHDEYAIFLRGRIERLEEKAGISNNPHKN